MTTEDDFQRMLDANPADWQTREVFADWLEDHDDPRAAEYLAIARQQRHPLEGKSHNQGAWWWYRGNADFYNNIPDDWFDLLPPGPGSSVFWPVLTSKENIRDRRQCEDALALAFAQLPEARRRQLLNLPA